MDARVTLVDQGERGRLWALEGKAILFPIARIYTISGVEGTIPRGQHAHHKTDQVIFAVNGAFTLDLDDGKEKTQVRLNAGDPGVRLPPMLWHSMSDFSEGALALVVASLPYEETDYIRDYEAFKKYASTV